jgi:hypothetical protein
MVHNLDECSHSISASDADLTGCEPDGGQDGTLRNNACRTCVARILLPHNESRLRLVTYP